MAFKIVAVCISKDDLTSNWKIPLEIPFYSHTEDYQYFPHFPRLKTRFRIEYLAKRRNGACKRAIEKHPDLTHFLMLDSYYLQDIAEVRQLISNYKMLATGWTILGASTWYVDPSRIRKRYWFWDSWTNPEFNMLNLKDAPKGWIGTKGVGGMSIIPRAVWEKQGFGIPEPFPESGCEMNYLSRCPGTETFIDFDVKAWRDPPEELMNKPYSHRVRTSLGIGTKMRKMGIPDIAWILKNRVFLPQQRKEWLQGHVKRDGYRWNTRGIRDTWLAYRGHEDWLRHEILNRGDLFVDVGTHVGTWSIRASRHYRQVVSFEPSNSTRKVLEKNILDNNIENIYVYDTALGAENGEGMMHQFARFDGGNSLLEKHPILSSKGRSLNSVKVRTLDSYGFEPTLLKIDTEGYELPVLAGAKETLKHTGKIIVECHRDEDVLKIRDVLVDSGFKTRLNVHPNETHVIGEH